MAAPLPPTPVPASTPFSRLIGRTRTTALLVMLVILILCVIFSWTTRDAMDHLPFRKGTAMGRLASSQKTLVDLSPWQTASALAPLSVSNEEAEYAQEAERLADHEVDQAFASALRQATEKVQHSTLTGDALALSKRVSQFEDLVKDDKDQVQQYSPSPANPAKANDGDPTEDTQDDLEIAKAQLGLDTDQLNDVQDDLARASGDDRAQIQSELQEHEASMKEYDNEEAAHKQKAVISVTRYGTLAALIGGWNNQRSRYTLIVQAQQQALHDVTALTAEHNALQARVNAPQAAAAPGVSDHAAKLAAIKERSAQQQLLSIYDDRIQTQNQLAVVYGKWANQVLLQHRMVMHRILGSLSRVVLIIIVVLLCDALLMRLMEHPNLDRRRMLTLRAIFRLSLQLIGLVLVALAIFGTPREMPTILGLVTAGLTVVLQDFILAFFGWFVLMGKHGIHVGDWVEINGVGGEVTEISLFSTTLLETGNWTDKGHPTGRRVTFINSFAIRGQYFNFSTTSQWMWDELSVSVPAGEDTYAMVESIHKAVIDATEKDARIAEGEWKRGSRSDGLSQFTADATVNLRPSAAGVDVLVRYVTRASDRFETRNRLFQKVLDVLHAPAAEVPAGTSANN
jgi:small-conductance mechanosensitive channel